jgi:hypothetical protein
MKLRGMALSLGILVAGCSAAADDVESGALQAGAPVHSQAELQRMRAFVDRRIDRSAIRKTLRTASGRQVHCIDIDKQPALNGEPVAAPPRILGADNPTPLALLPVPEPMLEIGSAREDSCAPGTVPIPEVTMEDIRRFKSLDEFFMKTPPNGSAALPAPAEAAAPAAHNGPTDRHQYAHAYRSVTNWGAQANMNVWNPSTQQNSEFSLGQLWVSGGSFADDSVQTLEAGLQHYHQLYGDDKMHLFIYSTRDNYQNLVNPGCYNNTCGDFVQVSTKTFPSTTWYNPVSSDGGTQYAVNVSWVKAGETGSWWLSVQNEWVGYYPRSTFAAVANHASDIDFGGEIVDNHANGLHTSTKMGSGALASAGWQHAAYMNRIRYNNANPSGTDVTFVEATGLVPTQTDANCYSISYTESADANWKTFFYYGGPGFHTTNCR